MATKVQYHFGVRFQNSLLPPLVVLRTTQEEIELAVPCVAKYFECGVAVYTVFVQDL